MTLGDAPVDSEAVGDEDIVEVGVGVEDTDAEAPRLNEVVGVPEMVLVRDRESVPVLDKEVEGVLDAVEPCERVDEDVKETVGVAVSVEVEVRETVGVAVSVDVEVRETVGVSVSAEVEVEVRETVEDSVLEGLEDTQASEAATLLQPFSPHR